MSKKILGLLLLILFLLGSTAAVQAQSTPSSHGKVYMMVVNGLSISDINKIDTPCLTSLIQEGTVGLASNRTLRGNNKDDVSLTIGAGNLARDYSNRIMAFNSDEEIVSRNQSASHLYENLTGINPGKSASLLVNLPEIITGMQKENVITVPGSLGEALRKNNLKVCVLGNGDVNEMYSRSSVAIGMDAEGRVPLGDVGPRTYKKDAAGSLGWQTDYDYLSQQVNNYRNQTDLMIVELSDLDRLENSDTPYPEIGQANKRAYLRKIDEFIARVNKQIDPRHDLIMVISATPAQLQITNKNTFTPVIISGPGYNKGFLTSGATRRDYIVANTDIAPTVLNFFGITADNRSMIGRPMETKSADGADTLEKANNISNSAATVNRIRVPLVKGYVVLLIIIITLSVLAIFWISRLTPFVESMIIGLVTIPLAVLPLGKLNFTYDWEYILAAIFITIVLAAGLIYLFKKDMFKAFVVICAITALALNLDLFTGSTMISTSALGYDAMAGARYYGIGNEYMGILIGATIILATVLYEKFSKPWFLGIIGLMLLAECYVIAGPSLGANSDGVLTAPFGYLVTIALLSNMRINPKIVLGMAGIILMSVLGITVYDMHRPVELQTHIGRAANQIMLGGWKTGLTIIARKMGMNIKLIRYTIWSRVFLVMLVVLALLVYRPVGAMRKLRQDRPMIIKGFAGIIGAAIVGLIINDSGIVAAATISIYLVLPILLLMFDLQKKGDLD